MELTTRRATRVRPALEGLEDRQLLSTLSTVGGGSTSGGLVAEQAGGTTSEVRQISYRAPGGERVVITVHGPGSLAGSSLTPGGALSLVIGGTNGASFVAGHIVGGAGRVPLQSITYAGVSPSSLSGVGGSPVNQVRLTNFDLVPGGLINLTAGVHLIALNSIAANSQVQLRELPESFQGTGLVSTATSNGVTLTYVTNPTTGGQVLASVSGQFVAGTNLPVTKTTTFTRAGIPGTAIAPPGMVVVVNHINGNPRPTAGLPDPEIYGYDSVTSSLIRFDANTGEELQSIPLAGLGTPVAGVSLGHDNGRLVALVGFGTTIRAYDAVTGTPVGQFSTTNLAKLGFHTIDEMGSSETQTVLGDATAGAGGELLAINVGASLATGQAVPSGAPFAPQRQFELAGGLTGVAGSNTVFAAGAAHFDTFQPDLTQFGFLAVNAGSGRLSEASRTALKANGNFIDVGPSGTVRNSPTVALGSVDQNLALVTGVSQGKNIVTLYSQSLSPVTTIGLNDPNHLSGLSESFRPGLAGAVLVDVQGNIQSFRATNAEGLVLNDLGNLNLVQINRAADSTIIGMPFSHAAIAHRLNVTIISSSRAVGDRNGVIVVPGIIPAGPLSLP